MVSAVHDAQDHWQIFGLSGDPISKHLYERPPPTASMWPAQLVALKGTVSQIEISICLNCTRDHCDLSGQSIDHDGSNRCSRPTLCTYVVVQRPSPARNIELQIGSDAPA